MPMEYHKAKFFCTSVKTKFNSQSSLSEVNIDYFLCWDYKRLYSVSCTLKFSVRNSLLMTYDGKTAHSCLYESLNSNGLACISVAEKSTNCQLHPKKRFLYENFLIFVFLLSEQESVVFWKMADDESEGDPGSSDTRQPATAFGEKETTHARLNLPAQVSLSYFLLSKRLSLSVRVLI